MAEIVAVLVSKLISSMGRQSLTQLLQAHVAELADELHEMELAGSPDVISRCSI